MRRAVRACASGRQELPGADLLVSLCEPLIGRAGADLAARNAADDRFDQALNVLAHLHELRLAARGRNRQSRARGLLH
jgi:hypothetical protein